MKKITILTFVCLSIMLTACGRQSEIPPVDLIEIPVPSTDAIVATETATTPQTTPEATSEESQTTETNIETMEVTTSVETETVLTTSFETTVLSETDSEEETELTTEAKPKNTAWVKVYRKILAEHCDDSVEETTLFDEDSLDDSDFDDDEIEDIEDDKKIDMDNQWFVLIYLDDDNIPELVILDDTEMELYCFDGKNAQLLLEDSYKSDALEGQNVCYQPYTGYIASAFTTMSGGDGFTIYHFDQLDAVHVQRYYFNNNENIEGEMAYNEIWDRAEEFEVIDGGYHDVTLGESWTHITSKMDGAFRLTLENANTLTADLAPDIEYPSEQDPSKDETEEEE